MTLGYFSWSHILYIAIAIVFTLALYFLFKSKSEKAQKCLVLTLALMNVIQHLFKMYIYPQYDGGFNALSSAYNMCATLILLSPLVYLIPSRIFRDFVLYIGTAAGIVAILIPYWNIGTPAFSWEVYRFFICHVLLFASSILPLLFRHHRPSWKCFYKLPLCFFAVIALIIINDIAFIYMGLYPGFNSGDLSGALEAANPVWSFGPPQEFNFVVDIAKFLSPDIFVGDNPTGKLVPVLWYFIPLYIGICILSFPICALADFDNFKSDMKKYRENMTRMAAFIKVKLKKSK